MIIRLKPTEVKELAINKPDVICIYKNYDNGFEINIKNISNNYILIIERFDTVYSTLSIEDVYEKYNCTKVPRILRDILRSNTGYPKWLIDVLEYLNNDIPIFIKKENLKINKKKDLKANKERHLKINKNNSNTNSCNTIKPSFKCVQEYNLAELQDLLNLNYKELQKLKLKKIDIMDEILCRRKYEGNYLFTKISHEIPSVVNFHFSFTLSNLIKNSWLEFGKEVRQAHPYCELTNNDEYKIQLHEIWGYDIENKVIILLDLMALCPYCHNLQHASHTLLMQNQGFFIDYDPNEQIKVIEKSKEITMKNYNYYIRKTSEEYFNMEEKMKQINIKNAEFFIQYKNSLNSSHLIENGWKFHIYNEYKGVSTKKMQYSLLKKNLLYIY